MERNLPPYISRELVSERLPLIFPEGTPNRNYCIRLMAASTVFTMLYIGAVEGLEIYAGPKHVYRMTDEQSLQATDEARKSYSSQALRKGVSIEGKRWYADNTREPIRDETLREGLQQVGAVVVLTIPTTSSKPRYALKNDFARLFDPSLSGDRLLEAIKIWQEQNLSAGALMRISLAGRASGAEDAFVFVTLPNGEVRRLSTGPSSDISKAVVEVFSKSFLVNPAVLWISTSDAKVSYFDDRLANSIGLQIQADKNLPDIILADLTGDHPLLVFVEVVATDGAITQRRQDAIYDITDAARISREHITFLTAYHDRQKQGFKKTITDLAWGSFAWFVSEPHNLIHFTQGEERIIDILRRN